MPNWCSTRVTLRCKDEAASHAVYDKLKSWNKSVMDTDFGDAWLGNILVNSGFCSGEKACYSPSLRCRGFILWIKTDGQDVLIDTETAWAPMLQMWRIVCDRCFPEVTKILYTAEEPGMEVFITNDEDIVGNVILDIPAWDFYETGNPKDILTGFLMEVKKQKPKLFEALKAAQINTIDAIARNLFQFSGIEAYVHVYEYCDIEDLD